VGNTGSGDDVAACGDVLAGVLRQIKKRDGGSNMELREALKRINDMCDDRETCDDCALYWHNSCALNYVPCEITTSDIDQICKIIEQMEQEQEEQNIENAQLYVINHLDDRTKLEQLAEEAAELSQAALKLIRAKGLSNNVTPIDEKEALANVREEIIDVLACIKVYDYELDGVDVVEAMENSPKWLRWAERLKGECK
jgi:NTP pyrophosphatase (non-canonical NTP hydrolase)